MNGGDILIVAVVLLAGCAAFVVGVLYMCFSACSLVGRGLMAMVWPDRRKNSCGGGACRLRTCSNPKCRAVDRRNAKYCGHCGTALEP